MANYIIWAGEMAHKAYDNIYTAHTTDPSATAKYALDGDPETLWQAEATSAIFTVATSAGNPIQYVRGVAVSNHNWVGAYLVQISYWNGATYTSIKQFFTFPTSEDWLYDFGSTLGPYDRWRIDISSATSNVTAGSISFLTDWGTTDAGANQIDQGYTRISFTDGPTYPIQRNLSPPVAYIQNPGGGFTSQYAGGPAYEFQLNMAYPDLNGSTGQWDKVEHSWFGRRTPYVYRNPGWHKGVWLTDDTYNSDTPVIRAYYCHAMPGSYIGGAISMAGPRVAGQIGLRTKSKGY